MQNITKLQQKKLTTLKDKLKNELRASFRKMM